MCENAVDGILMQCGLEDGFSQYNSLQPTDVTILNIEDLKLLPSNNLNDGRNLAEFGLRARSVEKCINFKLTAK